MNSGRFAVFLTIVLSVWAAMHWYVGWRVSSVPWVTSAVSRRGMVLLFFLLALSYPAARLMNARGWHEVIWPLEFAAASWIGLLFLLLSVYLILDVLTLGGFLFRPWIPPMRAWGLAAGLAMAALAQVQGLRSPVARHYEVALPGLPPERDGLVMVAISDLHLGTLIGRRWLNRLVEQVRRMEPSLVVIVGDLIDGNAEHVEQFIPDLRQLQAPLGVWAVTGNHEFYAGVEPSARLMRQAGFTVLRDQWVEAAPGLALGGVDDLTARAQFGLNPDALYKVLSKRPAGAAILLSHSPWGAEECAEAGIGLMISGHTHHGQIWPFNFLVRLRYPLIGGRYLVRGMPVIVSRGAGTWGPRMRLWRPGELLRITLRSAPTAVP